MHLNLNIVATQILRLNWANLVLSLSLSQGCIRIQATCCLNILESLVYIKYILLNDISTISSTCIVRSRTSTTCCIHLSFTWGSPQFKHGILSSKHMRLETEDNISMTDEITWVRHGCIIGKIVWVPDQLLMWCSMMYFLKLLWNTGYRYLESKRNPQKKSISEIPDFLEN